MLIQAITILFIIPRLKQTNSKTRLSSQKQKIANMT